MLYNALVAETTVIGIDVGGTKSVIGLFERRNMSALDLQEFPTDASRGFPVIFEDICSRVDALRAVSTAAVGMGVPGLVRHADGTIRRLPNIPGGEGFPLRDELARRLHLTAAVDNDSNCFTLAEAVRGGGANRSVVVGVTMGTGVGGGIVIDGKLFRGAEGFAGEIGHMLLQPGEPPFETKDIRGDVEQFLSGTALRKRCAEARNATDVLEGDACVFLRPELVSETAQLCASVTHMLNPSVIIFGGTVGRALRSFLPAIEGELTRWVIPGTPLPSLAVASLDHPAAIGAAMLTSRD